MMEQTNLDAVKSVARSFLYLDFEVNKKIPFLVMHPFFEQTIAAVRENGESTMLDITKPEELKRVRKVIAANIDAVEHCLQFLVLIRPPYLPAFFKHSCMYLSLADFSSFLGSMWTYVEFPNADLTVSLSDFVRYFRTADKAKVMEEEEYRAFCALPDEITVYRGVKPNGKIKALSWTLNKDRAEWFANRFESDGCVYRAVIKKEDVLAYFSCRNEEEIVLDYKKLIDVTKEA